MNRKGKGPADFYRFPLGNAVVQGYVQNIAAAHRNAVLGQKIVDTARRGRGVCYASVVIQGDG